MVNRHLRVGELAHLAIATYFQKAHSGRRPNLAGLTSGAVGLLHDDIRYSASDPSGLHPIAAPFPPKLLREFHYGAEAAAGVFQQPGAAPGTIFCAYPRQLRVAAEALAVSVAQVVEGLTGRAFSFVPINYGGLVEAISQLRRAASGGTVLFVLDGRPESYYTASFELPDCRIKRVTWRTVEQKYVRDVEDAAGRDEPGGPVSREVQGWIQFAWMTALDLVQQMDGVSWRIPSLGPYDAMLSIDVGHGRRFVATSLLVARPPSALPSFWISSRVHHKPDTKQEAINGALVADHVAETVAEAVGEHGAPLRAPLVLRDGKTVGDELKGLASARGKLEAAAHLQADAPMDVVDVHKNSLKPIRLWEVDAADQVSNPLEGTVVRLNATDAVVACTGAATLRQGTAKPVLLCRREGSTDITEVAAAVFSGAQFNWSPPGVAQRLPLPLRRTNEELSARASQEVWRVS